MISAKDASKLCDKHEVVKMLSRVANERVLEACSRNVRFVENINVPADVEELMICHFKALGYNVESCLEQGSVNYLNIYWD